MQKDDQVLLHHMLDAAREAVTFTLTFYGRRCTLEFSSLKVSAAFMLLSSCSPHFAA